MAHVSRWGLSFCPIPGRNLANGAQASKKYIMAGDPFPQDLVRYLSASTGLSQSTAIRVVADINAYYDETVDEFVRRRHGELRAQGQKNDEIWPRITAELNNRRFKAGELTDRQLRRIIYG
jgi:hypothetical protein